MAGGAGGGAAERLTAAIKRALKRLVGPGRFVPAAFAPSFQERGWQGSGFVRRRAQGRTQRRLRTDGIDELSPARGRTCTRLQRPLTRVAASARRRSMAMRCSRTLAGTCAWRIASGRRRTRRRSSACRQGPRVLPQPAAGPAWLACLRRSAPSHARAGAQIRTELRLCLTPRLAVARSGALRCFSLVAPTWVRRPP